MAFSFHYLDKIAIADTAFEARGDSPAELCMASAQALIEVLANASTVQHKWEQQFVFQEETLEDMLFEWLSAIVYIKDVEGVVFCDSIVTVTTSTAQKPWEAVCLLRGDRVNPMEQELGVDVKAITKHLYEVSQQGREWVARVVIDT
ncbi:MAG: archease [Nitrospirae bacterium]|nr:archease [Nitrospirota bacterium]